MNRITSLVVFLVIVLGGGIAIGGLSSPDDWYAQLAKPSFNPPGWIFGPVWTALYIMIAIAGWHLWHENRNGWAMRLWWIQLILNFAWSPIFFSAHQIGGALVVISVLLIVIIAIIAITFRQHRLVTWLFVPYAAWVAFASVLNAALFVMN